MPTGIKETQDLVKFIGITGEKVLRAPHIVATVKGKQWGALGGILAGIASDPEFQAAAVTAFDGIGNVPAELKDVDVFEGIVLGKTLLEAAQAAALAYQSGNAV